MFNKSNWSPLEVKRNFGHLKLYDSFALIKIQFIVSIELFREFSIKFLFIESSSQFTSNYTCDKQIYFSRDLLLLLFCYYFYEVNKFSIIPSIFPLHLGTLLTSFNPFSKFFPRFFPFTCFMCSRYYIFFRRQHHKKKQNI